MMRIQNKRIIKILEILDQNKYSVTSEYIAGSLGVSRSTIRRDIKELNIILHQFDAGVTAEAGSGYRLNNADNSKYLQMKEKYGINLSGNYRGVNIVPFDYNDRISFIIARILLNSLHNKVVNQEELADELFLSLSTLKKYLSDIKKSLSRFNLRLVTDRLNGVRIDGAEAQIRYCISEYIFNRDDLLNLSNNDFFNDIFPQEEIETVKHILMKIILKYNIHLTDVAFKNLLVHVVITMRRSSNKNTVEYTHREQKKLQQSTYFNPATEILEVVKRQLGVDIDNEVYYLTQHFIASQKFIESSKSRDESRNLINNILQRIKDNTGFDLSEDSELVSGLMIHLIAAINRLKFNMSIRNEILTPIKNNYPVAFEMAVIASEVIEEQKKVKTNENEIGFLAIHFGASLERNKLNKEKGKTAIIVCGTGLSTALLLKSKLQRRYGAILQIKKVMSCYELTEELIDGIDFIFSTVPVPNIKTNKIIRVEPIMTEDDFEKVEARLSGIQNAKNVDYEKFFKRELFFSDFEAGSACEVIRKISTIMIKKGYIDKNIQKSIFARESMSSTEIGNFVAVPHALENDMKEAAVAVSILEKAIRWDKTYVQIVFLLCIPKTLYSVWEPVFKNIYQKFIHGNYTSKFLKNPNYIELMNILKK
ncbi:BglG family transcription antiterminator [Pectinatus frisingensis]|uniref:BglG family transcription antiterminator n=1 Tax=Pectinatus frisingensis TaxID=865 RepID=UPI001E508BE4|nr:BglG family transcription antiterminator [Pectinatus frisingensis]